MVVALSALDRGLITPATRISCGGKVQLGDAVFHCWKRGGHGSLDLVGGLMNSCDLYFYEVARRVGIDRIAAMAEKFGLGTMLDVGLPGEKKGLMPTRAWKRAVRGQAWTQGETMIAGIGQGSMLISPLQLCVMTARLANGGRAVKPRLTAAVQPFDGDALPPPPAPEFEDMGIAPPGIAPAYLEAVLKGMTSVVNTPGGTAFRARITDPAYAMAGKTGSVQVRRISKLERETRVLKNEELPWRERDHALFVAFAPLSEPRYACSVVIEHGGGGSTAAAPVARDILYEVQRRDPSPGRAVNVVRRATEGEG
jgi:penicillin-binding protein 2